MSILALFCMPRDGSLLSRSLTEYESNNIQIIFANAEIRLDLLDKLMSGKEKNKEKCKEEILVEKWLLKKPWVFSKNTLSWNPNITVEYILRNRGAWNYSVLSINENILRDKKFIIDHKQEKWLWDAVLHRVNFTEDEKAELGFPHKPTSGSASPFIESEMDAIEFSASPLVTLKMIRDNIDSFPWNWDMMSMNPNITPLFIWQHRDKPWNITHLVNNKYSQHPFLIRRRAALTLQRRWRLYWNVPYYSDGAWHCRYVDKNVYLRDTFGWS